MDGKSSITLEALDEQERGIRLVFQRRGDRYGHTVYGVSGAQAEPIAVSVDQRSDDGWPLSPPVQEIREFEDARGGRQLMLVGAAAGSHWSMTAAAASLGNQRYLEFDVAVRVQQAPILLSIALEAVEGAEWLDLPSGLIVGHRDPYLLFVGPAADFADLDRSEFSYRFGTTAPAVAAQPAAGAEKRRILQPQIELPRTFPNTIRWRYCMGVDQ